MGQPGSGQLTLMNSTDAFVSNANMRSGVNSDGVFEVIAHGSPDSISIGSGNNMTPITVREAFNFISSNPNYSQGQSVRLLSCSTGANPNGFARQLSDLLGAPVHAPTDTLWALPNGNMVIGPDEFTPTGLFKWFGT
jgi:filamentous hemagglutinin